MNIKYVCPFCNHKIQGIYEKQILTYKKRKKIKQKTKKVLIGHDFTLHKETCREYQEFINSIK